MKRVWMTVLVLWVVVMVGAVVLLLARDDGAGDPDRQRIVPGPCTCDALGRRARRCEKELLAAAEAVTRGTLPPEERASARSLARIVAVNAVLSGAIRQGALARRCQHLRRHGGPLAKRGWTLVRRCWSEWGCADFARCLRLGAPRILMHAGP